ncbi:MAG: Sec-independent protein translocase protein TatB [Pyrinomonadaceae bacterium]
MYLLILESIGTQELILVGMVALIVFGPRKLPQMARKAGNFVRELRSVSNDFKATWAKEVNLDADPDTGSFLDKLGSPNKILGDETKTVATEAKTGSEVNDSILPEVREVSSEDFQKLVAEKEQTLPAESDKQNWL